MPLLRQAVRRAPHGATVLQPAVLCNVWAQQVPNIPRRNAASLSLVPTQESSMKKTDGVERARWAYAGAVSETYVRLR
jgi:hypothetical protein